MNRHDALIAKVTEVSLFPEFTFRKKLFAPCAKEPVVPMFIVNFNVPFFRLLLLRHLCGALEANRFMVVNGQHGFIRRLAADSANSVHQPSPFDAGLKATRNFRFCP